MFNNAAVLIFSYKYSERKSASSPTLSPALITMPPYSAMHHCIGGICIYCNYLHLLDTDNSTSCCSYYIPNLIHGYYECTYVLPCQCESCYSSHIGTISISFSFNYYVICIGTYYRSVNVFSMLTLQ